MTATDFIAIYAAIVATGALLLDIRRWIESGTHLYISWNVGQGCGGPSISRCMRVRVRQPAPPYLSQRIEHVCFVPSADSGDSL
jgi:hypothetical protein